MAARINSENRNPKKKIDLLKADRVARTALRRIGNKECEINLIFVSSQRIRSLNSRYFGRDRATDVIAFPAGDDPLRKKGKSRKFLGEVVISSDRAAVNSRIYGFSFMEEVALCVIHGILHLAGYEDSTDKGRSSMRKKENDILQEAKRHL